MLTNTASLVWSYVGHLAVFTRGNLASSSVLSQCWPSVKVFPAVRLGVAGGGGGGEGSVGLILQE